MALMIYFWKQCLTVNALRQNERDENGSNKGNYS